jgi:hypothetical protein
VAAVAVVAANNNTATVPGGEAAMSLQPKGVDDVLQKYGVPAAAAAESSDRKKSRRRPTTTNNIHKKQVQSSATDMEAEVAAFLKIDSAAAAAIVVNNKAGAAASLSSRGKTPKRSHRSSSTKRKDVSAESDQDAILYSPVFENDFLPDNDGSIASMDTGVSTLTNPTYIGSTMSALTNPTFKDSTVSSITTTHLTREQSNPLSLKPIGEADADVSRRTPPIEIYSSSTKRSSRSGDIEQGGLGGSKNSSSKGFHSDPKKQSPPSFFGQRSVQCGLLAILLLTGGAVGLGVSLGFGGDSDGDSSDSRLPTEETPTAAPVLAPSMSPTAFDLDRFQEEVFPDYTQDAIEIEGSPQNRAFDWLETDVALNSFSKDVKLQRFALSTFFYATGGEDWSINTDWLDFNQQECDWYFGGDGGPCNDGVYTDLFLERIDMAGSLPEELAILTGLQTIQLENGIFTGSIPTRLGELTDLEVLGLRNLGLDGEIPSELGVLTNLDLLLLSGNDLSGSIPSTLGLLTRLTAFLVSRGTLSGNIPVELTRCTNLELFSLRSNDLSGLLPTQFGLLTGLTGLSLYENLFSGSIPTEIGLLSNLEFLFLDMNALTGSIPSELGQLTTLVELWIGSNLLTGTVPAELCELVTSGLELQVDCDFVECDCGCLCSS